MDLARKLKWQSSQQRRDYFLATMMFKCIHGLAPTHMVNELEMVCERHDHNTRNADSLNLISRACAKWSGKFRVSFG